MPNALNPKGSKRTMDGNPPQSIAVVAHPTARGRPHHHVGTNAQTNARNWWCSRSQRPTAASWNLLDPGRLVGFQIHVVPPATKLGSYDFPKLQAYEQNSNRHSFPPRNDDPIGSNRIQSNRHLLALQPSLITKYGKLSLLWPDKAYRYIGKHFCIRSAKSLTIVTHTQKKNKQQKTKFRGVHTYKERAAPPKTERWWWWWWWWWRWWWWWWWWRWWWWRRWWQKERKKERKKDR